MFKCEIHQTVCLDAADGRANARAKDLYVEMELPFVPAIDMELALKHMDCSTVDRVVWSQELDSFLIVLEEADCVGNADAYKAALAEAKTAGWKEFRVATHCPKEKNRSQKATRGKEKARCQAATCGRKLVKKSRIEHRSSTTGAAAVLAIDRHQGSAAQTLPDWFTSG